MNKTIINIGDKLWDILDIINDTVSFEFYGIYKKPVDNPLDIIEIDAADEEGFFEISTTVGTKYISVYRFLKLYFPDLEPKDVFSFIEDYNDNILGGFESEKIVLGDFKFNPKDVRSTFLSLTSRTYPYKTESEVLQFLPDDLQVDKYGNYYKIIGESTTMFTSHLDTASHKAEKVSHHSYKKDDDEIICTDGNTILGADDKAGTTVMLYMMAHNVPGVYMFFIGEERGGIGSSDMAADYNSYEFSDKITKVVSFDRRNYNSVITSQSRGECCSPEFAQSLCSELNKYGLDMKPDNTGVFTDSANFTKIVPECTNISVGYFNEHTTREIQNITFLEKLAKVCVKVDWESLTVKRKVGFAPEINKKFGDFIQRMRYVKLYNDGYFYEEDGRLIYELEVSDADPNSFASDIKRLDILTMTYKVETKITFLGSSMLIEIIK